MIALASISLVAPAMLGGLALLSLPVIAHLLNRRARRHIVFPSIRFLAVSTARQSSIFRLRRWILLLLRSLAVILIVLAFAHPVWMDARARAAADSSGVAAVLIIDASASTGRVSGGVSDLSSLRASAQRTLESLRPGTDLVEVIVAGGSPRALFQRLSPNIPAAQAELSKLEPGHGRADLLSAVALAGQTLAPHQGERRVVIFSDLQLSNWREIIEGSQLGAAMPPGTRITLAGPASSQGENTAVTEGRLIPASPIAGRPAEVRFTVRNFGELPRTVKIQARLNGAAIGEQAAEIPPWTQAEAAFEVTLPTVGEHRIEAAIGDDALGADNHAYISAAAVARMPVLLVGDDDIGSPGTASYFLHRALSPRGDEGDAYAVATLQSGAITTAALRTTPPPAAVILSESASLSRDAAFALARYAIDGGALVIFCGQGPVAENLAALDSAGGESGLLPWRPGPMRIIQPGESPLAITRGAWGDPMLRIFDGPGRTALATAGFTRTLSAASAIPDGGALLLFSDGSPALGIRGVGDGAVVLAAFSPDAACSDLAKSGAFVALVHSVLDALPTRRGSATPSVVGRTIERRIAAGPGIQPGSVRVLGPDGEPLGASVSGSEGTIEVLTDPTQKAGFYRVVSADTTLAIEAVNIDPRESDPRRADTEMARARLEGGSAVADVALASAAPALTPSEGRPLWHVAIFLAAAALAAEMALLSVWKR